MNQPIRDGDEMKDKNSVSAGKDLTTVSSEELAAQGDGQPCPHCQCDGTIEGRKGRELQQQVTTLREALESIRDCGMLASCDNCRNIARAALAAVVHPQK